MAEMTCGQELAASAEVPAKLGELMQHVAVNLRVHAGWVGEQTDAARAEHEAMIAVAEHYERIGLAAVDAARTMRSLEDLVPPPHDATSFDRAAFGSWMREKIRMQREFAQLLV